MELTVNTLIDIKKSTLAAVPHLCRFCGDSAQSIPVITKLRPRQEKTINGPSPHSWMIENVHVCFQKGKSPGKILKIK